MTLLSEDLASRYQMIVERVTAAKSKRRSTQPVTLIAVSKKQPTEAIESLYHLGHRDFGENYAQELVAKAKELEARGCSGIRWHFIGHLQTNKIKMILPHVFCIHTVDSEKLALQLSKACLAIGRNNPFPIFVEVNIDEEQNKSGIFPSHLDGLVQKIAGHPELKLNGLMCIPATLQDPRPKFKALNNLESRLKPLTNGMLSMGMSDDFDVAIEEGATHVRVGTALFGARN